MKLLIMQFPPLTHHFIPPWSKLDIHLLRPESSFISCGVVLRISDDNGVLLEVEWDEHGMELKLKE
jgi:hypothetical protein